MSQTIAEKLIEEGREESVLQSMQHMLLMLLRERFGERAEKVVKTVEQTNDISQLEDRMKRFAKARSFRDLGIR